MLAGLRLVALVSALSVSLPAVAEERDLAGLLALMPENPLTYRSFPLFGYVDFRAMERAAGVETPASEAALADLPEAERQAWFASLLRIKSGPPSLIRYLRGIAQHQVTSYDATGPDWFAIDRALAIWQLPQHTVSILSGGDAMTDSEGFDYALPGRGFAQDEIDGVTVWHRFGDNAIASRLKDEAIEGDIFDNELMSSLRIAVSPGLLIGATTWPDLRAVLGVRSGAAPPAAAAAVLVPMIEAFGKVDGVDGPVLQAFAFALPDVGMVDTTGHILIDALAAPGPLDIDKLTGDLAAGAAPANQGAPLPLYPLVLFADLPAPGMQVNVIALPYAERADAEAAAEVLAGRLRAWRPGTMARPVVEEIGATVDTLVIDDGRIVGGLAATFLGVFAAMMETPPVAVPPAAPAGEGGAVAIVAVRYPLPVTDAETKTGTFLDLVLLAAFNRGLTPLSVP